MKKVIATTTHQSKPPRLIIFEREEHIIIATTLRDNLSTFLSNEGISIAQNVVPIRSLSPDALDDVLYSALEGLDLSMVSSYVFVIPTIAIGIMKGIRSRFSQESITIFIHTAHPIDTTGKCLERNFPHLEKCQQDLCTWKCGNITFRYVAKCGEPEPSEKTIGNRLMLDHFSPLSLSSGYR